MLLIKYIYLVYLVEINSFIGNREQRANYNKEYHH